MRPNPSREKIIAAVKGGMTYTQVARKFAVTRNVVAGICDRAGLRVGLRESSRKAMGRYPSAQSAA